MRTLLILCLLFTSAGLLVAGDDRVKDTKTEGKVSNPGLEAAKKVYEQDMKKAQQALEAAKAKFAEDAAKTREKLVKAYDIAIKQAIQKDDLESSNSLMAEKKALEKNKESEAVPEDANTEKKTGKLGENKEKKVPAGKAIRLVELKPETVTRGDTGIEAAPLVSPVKELGGQKPMIDGEPCGEFLWTPVTSTVVYKVPNGAKYFSAIACSLGQYLVKFTVRCNGEVLYTANLDECPDKLARASVELPKDPKFLELKAEGGSYGSKACWCYPKFIIPN